MKFSFTTLHEKGWVKSLTAGVGLLVGVVGLAKAVLPLFFDSHAATAQTASAPSAHMESNAARVEEQVREAAPLVANAARPAPAAPRHLDNAVEQQLLNELSDRGATVLVVCARGDNEAKRFGQEIALFLHAQGYNVSGLSFTAFPPNFQGIDTEKDGNRAFVKVGRRPE